MRRVGPFNEIEIDGGRPVIVIGHNVAAQLFPQSNPIGKVVEFKGKKLRVVGVTALSGSNMFGSSPDDMALIPYTLGARLFDMRSKKVEKMISVKVSDPKYMARVEDEIVGLMRSARGMRPRTENDFEINRPEMLIKMFSSATDYLRIGGIFISLFSIVVGGFGIGNIMFSTVKERTFEIGVQKALGATLVSSCFSFSSNPFSSVFLEDCWACSSIMASRCSCSWRSSSLAWGFTMVTSWGSLGLGVLISVLIGLISGFIPASLAAKWIPWSRCVPELNGILMEPNRLLVS